MDVLEIIGAVIGIIYLILEYKANVWLWPAGILMSLCYVIIFFQGKFYADAAVYLYYIGANVYGLCAWLKRSRAGYGSLPGENAAMADPIQHTPKSMIPKLTIIFVLVYALIAFVLVRFTDSPVPFGDAFTTSLSIVAMYMLAKKWLEQWLLWIVVNVVSTALYLWKGLYPTAVLFIVYVVVAVMGYFKWRRDMLVTTSNLEPLKKKQ